MSKEHLKNIRAALEMGQPCRCEGDFVCTRCKGLAAVDALVVAPQPAPLPELSDRDTLRARLNGFSDPVDAAITIIVAHESSLEDLTRRLAEAEANHQQAAADALRWEQAHEAEYNAKVAAEARVADLEAELSGVGVRQYREAVERLHNAEAERDALRERCGKLARILKHSQDVFDAIDMTGLCPLCQGDEDHNSGCPMRAVEEDIQAALAATEAK